MTPPMLRYRLRTLLILLALLPPLLWIGWGKYQAWKAELERQRAMQVRFGPAPIAIDFAFPIRGAPPSSGTVPASP